MLAFAFESELLSNKLVGSALLILDVIKMFLHLGFSTVFWTPAPNRPLDNDGCSWSLPSYIGGRLDPRKKTLTSNRVRLPAELKHINKRRKRN
jgi:hypothetical protein